MQLVLCVDLDDDLGRKTGIETPVIGRSAVEEAAVALGIADAEDSDVNVIFEGLSLHDELTGRGEPVEIAVVTGMQGDEVGAGRQVGREVDTVIETLAATSEVRGVIVTDGAQDESVVPIIRSRIMIDGIRRVVVRQAQNLESMYYTIKQVLADPETRGTILVPLGILVLIYPLAVLADYLGLPGAVLGVTSALIGLYILFRGLGLDERLNEVIDTVHQSLYAGRVTMVTYVVAIVLVLIGAAEGLEMLRSVPGPSRGGPLTAFAAFTFGAVRWLAAAGITSSLGRITDEYLIDRFEWRYLNAPFYVLAITAVLHAVSGYFVGIVDLGYVAAMLTAGTLLGVVSTLTFAIIETRHAASVRA